METAQLVALIVAALGLLGNLVVAILSNHRLKSIDQNKRMNELETYRYTKLYTLLERRDELLDKLCGDPTNREIERGQIVVMLFQKAKPLVEQSFWGDIEPLIRRISETKIDMCQNVHDTNCFAELGQTLVELTGKLEEKFVEAIQSQLQELLKK